MPVRIAVAIIVCAMSAVARAGAPEPEPASTPAAAGSAPEPAAPAVEPAPAPVAPAPLERRPVAGFAIRGDSKVTPRTLGYLAHVAIGDIVGPDDIPRLEQALLSSELFKTVSVGLEPAPGDPSPGVIVAVTAVDKHSWIAAPTLFLLPGNRAFGVGFAENNFRGVDRKFLIYGQIGTRNSLLLGSFLDPAYHGTQLTWRTDLYLYRRIVAEYANPPGDPRSFDVERETMSTYLGGGALIGWNFLWWLAADLRLRGAYVYFRDTVDASGQPAAIPEKDGRDISVQANVTLDHRSHRYGVTWGSYVHLHLDAAIPGLDTYGYQIAQLRAYHSWRLFGEHELELRGQIAAGRHLPLHEDLTIGGASDLRGYDVDQFRGDLRAVARAEYSIPLFRWRFLSFRAIGFYDGGYAGFHNPRPGRDYLANQLGPGYWRNNAGGGLRIYLDNIVLPLLGFDVAYGFEGHAPEIYFEVGLTDF